MPYTPTLEHLERLVAKSYKTDDIEERADQAGLAQEKLVALLADKIKDIWDSASKEQVQLEHLEAEYESKLTTRVATSLERQARLIKVLRRLAFIVPLFSLVLLGLWYFKVTKAGLGTITQRPLSLVLLIVIGAVVAVLSGYFSKRSDYDLEESKARDKIKKEVEFVDLNKMIADSKEGVDDAVIAQGIKPKIRELLASRLNLPFSSHLPKLDFSGLSEVFNSANEVATDAKRQLEFMLNTMPGGSIGIAGPRGSGKSTLLKSACAERPDNIDKRKVMPLLTTSPVEYQGRDFILHLFSAMCVKILETTTNRKRAHTALAEVAEIRQAERISIFMMLGPLAPYVLVLGGALIAFSVVLALLTMNTTPPPTPATNAQTQAVQTQPDSTTQTPAQPQPTPKPTPRFVVRFVQALDLKPGTLFISGLLMVLFYVLLRYSFSRRRQLQRIYAHDPVSVIHGLKLDPGARQRLEEISDEAREWLREIKFQQSYTSGWSGALKLPIGLEGGISTAVSLAQQQLSLPDITRGFCDFLSAIARDFKVIIGIDELDKLESDEAAQRFLNEIKAIFGLPNVFYLISVSENAMSNFERRGLPFRDVFDSSFDNIVFVEYLNLEHAKRLIARRVIAMPPPFVHLCYCISGGLARDLVRTCRNLMQCSHKAHEAPGGPGSNLQALSAALIKSDLGLKLHALTVVAKKLSPGSGLNAFLDKLRALENELDSAPSLLQAYEGLLKGARPLPSEKTLTNGANGLVEVYDKLKQRLSGDMPNAGDTTTLYSLHEELATYIYYCVTLLEFFSEVLDANTLAQAEQSKAFDQLARARQYLAINASITRTMIDTFRVSFKMPVPVTAPTPAFVS